MDPISTLVTVGFGLCDCSFWLIVIAGGLWFFVFRNKGDAADPFSASASDVNKSLDSAASQSFAHNDEEDDVATVVAPQPKAVADAPPAAPKAPRPPRSAGATIIAFDDDDLLDD